MPRRVSKFAKLYSYRWFSFHNKKNYNWKYFKNLKLKKNIAKIKSILKNNTWK